MAERPRCIVCLRNPRMYPNPNVATYYGRCDLHFKMTQTEHIGYRTGGSYSAEKFFNMITLPGDIPLHQKVRSIVDLPFATGPDLKFTHSPRCKALATSKKDSGTKKWKYSLEAEPLLILNDIRKALNEQNILDRPFVFFVHSPLPHTGIYILLRGRLYTIGYGYILFSEEIDPDWVFVPEELRHGVIYSPDIALVPKTPSVILWIGLLTSTILDRVQEELRQVTEVRFYTKSKTISPGHDPADYVETTDKLSIGFVSPSRHYSDKADRLIHTPIQAKSGELPESWNCRIWAIYILFGDDGLTYFFEDSSNPFGPSLMNHNIGNDILEEWWTAYNAKPKDSTMLLVLTKIHDKFTPAGFYDEWINYLSRRNDTVYGRSDGLRAFPDDGIGLFIDQWNTNAHGGGARHSTVKLRRVRKRNTQNKKKRAKTRKTRKTLKTRKTRETRKQ